MMNSTWMLYGASGHTGGLIAEEAARRGQRPLLAGRSAEKLAPLAERLGLPWRALDLRDPVAVAEAVAQTRLVVNAASPFAATSEPLLRACLEAGASYADIANEIDHFQALQARDAEARRRGIVLMTGAGFGVVATDTLARWVADQLPDATTLEAAIHIYASVRSAGATKTGLDLLATGGKALRNGRIVALRSGAGAKRAPFPDGERVVVPAPLGELMALHQSTGIPTITVYSSALPSGALARAALPVVGRAMKAPALRRRVDALLDRQERQAAATPHVETGHSAIWVRATNAGGASVEAWLELGEGYLYSAAASVRVAEALLARRAGERFGALTPAQAFGSDFGLDIPGVRRLTAL